MLIKIHETNVKTLDENGAGVAVIATLNIKDKDNDVTLAGAFGEQIVAVVPAHDWQEAPIGKAKIHEHENEALADFKLNLKTDLGRNWYESLKFDLDHPPAKQEYSYGFTILDSGQGEFGGEPVRFLKKLQVHEVSPVLLGAGVGTRTVALKDEKRLSMADQFVKTMSDVEALVCRLDAIAEMRARSGRGLSKDRIEEIKSLKALIDRLERLIQSPQAADVIKGYFDLKNKFATTLKVS